MPEIPGRVNVDQNGEPAAPTRSIEGQARPAVEIPGDQATYDIVSKSPTLQSQWKQIKNDWRVEYRDGEGSYTSYRDMLVVIQKGSPTAQAQVIAHEFGHAVYPLEIDRSSKESCINSQLDNEGAATFNNIKIQREIIANGGPDIGIAVWERGRVQPHLR
ncbi:ImmA/IrrE family metallo-endopeptidase [Gordonia paraffinivorans]|uniref:ImmA/IrrE family metallo-endopeptidase n=1 Tax=Gordonia paraffinivorans TaxID=175628 RepID=UPI001E4E3B26|nr:ImmA/IrrE family metallo-endopeptidase [Gordonia paraffinivorans]MCD2147528.1 ImmA/IrrE family metallo-endopeptidase [Gordonia paraffinivorans]